MVVEGRAQAVESVRLQDEAGGAAEKIERPRVQALVLAAPIQGLI